MKMIRSSFTTRVHKMCNRFTTKIYFTACIAIYNVFMLHWKSVNYIATSSWGSGWRRDRNSQTATATNRRKRRVSSSISRSTCCQQRKSWHQQDTTPFAWRSSHLKKKKEKKKDHGALTVTKYCFVFFCVFHKSLLRLCKTNVCLFICWKSMFRVKLMLCYTVILYYHIRVHTRITRAQKMTLTW